MHPFPTGTVTLLFSDIEGSTHLHQQLGEGYSDLLVHCRQVLRTAFQQYHGHEIDTQGDSFFVAFARATDAVSAAAEAQRALAAQTWPDGVVMRVRMGLHTGEPHLAAEGYVGLDVHQAARIMHAAYGGQVLLSQTTVDLVEQDLPEGVRLHAMGTHRLKDMPRSISLFQLVIAGLPAEFPALKTLDALHHNLPVQPTLLIGREKEVAAIQRLFQREEVRLITLTGPGGTGKTRMALQVAAEFSDQFADGVYFVNLAPISDPTLVVSTISQALDIREVAGQSLPERLKEELRQKQVLLVLDNFEQVVSAALQVTDLIGACPKLKVLVTSREGLQVRGEHEFAVPPLALPDPTHLPELAQFLQYAAVALFIQHAQAVQHAFQVTPANAQAIAEICVRLDGLPLAIELASARVKLFPPQALLARLDQPLQILTSSVRDTPVRQQSLRNTIAWSYNLLDAEEQRLFRRLSVFVGGYTLEAIEAVCSVPDAGEGSMLACIASLLDKNLLQQIEQEGEPRLMMLETIREYGLEALAASGEIADIRMAHAEYYLTLAEETEPKLISVEQLKWLDRLEQEYDNLRMAFSWLLECEELELALRLGGALWLFWLIRAHIGEGQQWLGKALFRSGRVTILVRAKALYAAATIAYLRGEINRAVVLCEESLKLYRELGNKQGIANVLNALAQAMLTQGNYAAARAICEESLPLLRESGDRWRIAEALFLSGYEFYSRGDYAGAHTLYEESLALSREVGERRGIAHILNALGHLAYHQEDYTVAHMYYNESLMFAEEVGDKVRIALNLEGLANVIAAEGEPARAARLWGAAEAILDTPLPSLARADSEQAITATRIQIGERAFTAAWAEGQLMTPRQALAAQEPKLVLASPAPASIPVSSKPISYPDRLTPREVEILRLLAQGWTDAQVAKQLVISPRTVNSHLTSIYQKIRVSTRSAATRYAIEHHII